MKKLIQTVLKVMQVVAATAMLSALLPMSPAAANVEANIGTNFDEAALYSPVVSRSFANTMEVDVDDEGNIYTASVALQTQDLTHTRNVGVTETVAVGRGVKHGNNLIVTKVDKNGALVWAWELRAVSGKKQFGWWNDIAVAPDGTVHVVGYYKGFGHAWHHKAGDTPRPSINEDGTLIAGDYIMDYTPTQSLGQWVTINADGTTRHIKGLKATTSSYFESVDVDSNGDVLIAGRNHGQTWMDMNDHTGVTVNSSDTTPYIGKYEANGDLIWSRRLNKCGDYKHSSAWDATFTSDDRIAIVGAYSGTPTWSCAPDGGVVEGKEGPSSILGNSFPNHVTLGMRSYMAFMTSDGAMEYAREIGSVTQRSAAQQIVEHPVTGDLFILGIWENTIANPDDCGDGTPTDDRWFFAPAIPSADFPLIGDHSRFTRVGGVEPCSAHEPGNRNHDHYVLHTDSLGNLKNHKLLDVHLEKVYGPSLAINSDGSELAIVDSGIPESKRGLDHAKSGGSNGWVVALATSDLSENWRWINQNYTDPLLDASKVSKYSFSWTHGVAYGPEDKVHVAGRTQWSTLFGTTATGTDGTQIKTTLANTDAFVARYTLDGLLDNGAPAEVPQVAPDGYSIITPQTFQDDDGTYLIGPGGEVVWNEPLCAGGRWQVTPQPGIAVRQYMVSKDDVSGATAEEVLADAIRISHSGPDGTIPNYNILWQDGYDLDADGSSADHPDLFKVLGWDTGVADLDVAADLPVGFYFRQNMFTYNSNSNLGYAPGTRVDGHTWNRADYGVYLAFAHPGGTTDSHIYPVFTQVCPDTAGFTLSKDGLATSETGTSESFTVVLDSKPTAPVQILLVNTDTTEVSVNKNILTFTPGNWNTAQTVTVTGKGDGSPDGDITSYVNVSVNHDASSYEYASLANQIVDVVNENVDLLPAPPNPDLDGDGILNEDEVDGCVENADCDGDGINDGNEIPACILVADCDGDGLDDNKELVGCIQDPRCTDDNGNPISDDKPVVPETKPIEPDNPPAPKEPEVTEPGDNSKPQEDVIPDVVEDTDLDSDGDGILDVDEAPGCALTDDCDGDGITDDEDVAPTDPDRDNDGLIDGSDPDDTNPDTDGDGIPDGQDDDADGNGILDDDEQNGAGSGVQEPDLTINDADDKDGDPEDPTDPGEPAQTPKGDGSDGSDSPAVVRVLTDPKVLVGGGIAGAAGFAWLWFLARAIGFSNGLWWLLWLLLRRRRFCKICDCTLKKTKDGVWISVESGSHLGEDDHVHEPKFLRRVKPTPQS